MALFLLIKLVGTEFFTAEKRRYAAIRGEPLRIAAYLLLFSAVKKMSLHMQGHLI